MGKNLLVGVGSKARKVKALYVGVGGKARKVKKAYVGVGGKARLVYQSYVAVTGIAFDHLNSSNYNDLWIYFKLTPTNATNRSVTFTKNSGQIRFTSSTTMIADSNGYVYIRATVSGAFNTSVWITVTATAADGKSDYIKVTLTNRKWETTWR
ncbi:hypothetical protein DXA70_06270 [Faecalibacterium sp. OF04-11AC]|uniref:hypothetical protein n=1 Tax=Faecalibacterium sp. OF04-11AC TaxID=2293109 RepID=UPI000E8BF343|nr:hypothetical protein [Faecalibacterium sp. OF04-11AC]RGF78617.1 hypothetical protein DXA70_06270 [Faecalibacterium sp. OF04-11AC]